MQPPTNTGFAGREIIIVLLVLGVLSVFAYSAFRKVRISSQDKAVMCPIRQLAAAADQYYLENGVSIVAYADLVGATNYVKAVNTIAGENYPTLYTRGVTITVTGVAGVRTITYVP
ncbi:MAG: pilus assembly protein [bacterium]|nr:pilus assembly protein [bacterium]MDI1335269.1 pilus assembly protein [Lacunisphaera sp.]